MLIIVFCHLSPNSSMVRVPGQRLTSIGAGGTPVNCEKDGGGGATAVATVCGRGLGATRGAVGGAFDASGLLRSSYDVGCVSSWFAEVLWSWKSCRFSNEDRFVSFLSIQVS